MSKKTITDIVRPQARNANRHTQRGMGMLETSMQADGWIGAITVAADGETFDGSARVEKSATIFPDAEPIVIETDGTRPVIVKRTDIASATDERAVRLGIAANRVASVNLDWEPDVLAAIVDEQGIDLSGMFTDLEFDALAIPSVLPDPGDGGDEFDTTPADGPTRCQLGDLWVIGGKHRLIVGDCTDAATVERLMCGERAQGIFTSPPYDQQRTYEGNMRADWRALVSGAILLGIDHCEGDAQIFVNLGLIHREGRVVRYWDGLIADIEDKDWPLFGWYVWDKLNGMPGDWNGRLAPAHEWVFHFAVEHTKPEKIVPSKMAGKTAKGRTMRNPDGTLKGFTQDNVEYQSHKIPDSVVRLTQYIKNDNDIGDHPAIFPIALPETFMQAYNLNIWYEPFCGSGTSIIAAHRTGRRCYGCEIAPKYADVILRRAEAEGLTVELLERAE
jgi:DNA modification methylase